MKLHPDEFASLPFPCLHGENRLRNVPRQSGHHGDGVLGRRYDVSIRRVDNEDPAPACAFEIDVVHADAGAGDNLQPAPRPQNRLVHPGRASHDQGVDVLRQLQQFLSGDPGAVQDLEAFAFSQNLFRAGRERFRDEDADRFVHPEKTSFAPKRPAPSFSR